MQTGAAAAALAAWQPTRGQVPAAPSQWLLLGTGQGQGIYRARWNAATGEIGSPELAVASPQPTFLTLHPHLPVVYAANEVDVPAAAVSSYTLDRLTAHLLPLRTEPTHSGAPCFVSVDSTGTLLFAANYGGGTLTVFPLDRTGKPGSAAANYACTGNPVCGDGGPVKDRQSASHLHCATLAPGNRFVLACDLGNDAILTFPIHPGSARPLGSPTRTPTAPGAGPRHLHFHPNGHWLYCVNEINCTVAVYRWNPMSQVSRLEPLPAATQNIRPQGSAENPPSAGAELALSHDGRFLYASTRFSDVLTVFGIDPHRGELTQIQQLKCGGKTPRFFALDPTERWLVCANQDSNTLTVFRRDMNTGQLQQTGTYPALNPQCVLWI